MDHHIGRLVAHLKSTGEYDNTVFIFASDNGSEAVAARDPDTAPTRFVLGRQGYNVDYDTLGLQGSFNTIGPSFASAAAAPLAYYKFYAGEGGMRVPLIIAGEAIRHKNQFSKAFTYVTDIAPTILELSGVSAPAQRYGGGLVEPMIGHSLLPITDGEAESVYSADEAIGYELAGNAALFQGDYKIVLNRGPVGDNSWQLYNIVSDPGETRDLASAMPGRLQSMLGRYQQYVIDNAVQAIPADYSNQKQILLNGLREKFRPQIVLALLTLLILLSFYVVYRLTGQRRQ